MEPQSRVQLAITKRFGGLGPDIEDALQADLIMRGLDPQRAKEALAAESHMAGGKTLVTIRIKNDISIEQDDKEKPVVDLLAALQKNADAHNTTMRSAVSYSGQTVMLESLSKTDLVACINASLSDPDFHLKADKSQQR